MTPIIALVGRPNVGKSTLFNRLTKSRAALVADIPGLTRDRHYGHGKVGKKPFIVIDTGGFEPIAKDGTIKYEMARQTQQAIIEADVVAFIVDCRDGVNEHDQLIAQDLRRTGRNILLVVNKAEGLSLVQACSDFYELGLGDPWAISAAHGEGIKGFVDLALKDFEVEEDEEEFLPDPKFNPDDPNALVDSETEETETVYPAKTPKIAIVGRPNVGKSTLINTLLGEERVIAYDQPGTTRDSIYIDFEQEDRKYTLIDTAGLRRKSRVDEAIEKFSAIKTLQAIEDANVVILVLDARADIADQDAHIASFIVESGRALVVAVNKWEHLELRQREQVKKDLYRKLNFLHFAEVFYISALKNVGIKQLFAGVDQAYKAATMKLSTSKLTRTLLDAISKQPPPRSGMIRPKPRYAHQGGMNPPIVVIHGNALDKIPASYQRYLEGTFRDVFNLQGTPLRIQYKFNQNPFDPDRRR